jgi:hypothetical protein
MTDFVNPLARELRLSYFARMQTVSLILDELGGVTFVANETGIPLTTVHSWKRAGFVPRWRIPTLVNLANRLGKPITEACFPERRASAQDAAA